MTTQDTHVRSPRRRRFMQALGLGAVAALTPGAGQLFVPTASAASGDTRSTKSTKPVNGQFVLPALPYSFRALEPFIDAQTMQIHHGRHHAAYVTNLNAVLKDYPDLQQRDATDIISNLNDVPESIRMAVRNNAGGHVNHAIFWAIMGPQGGGDPTGQLRKAIENTFGSVSYMKSLVNDAAIRRFGSGWGWLVQNSDGSLAVTSTANQDSPYMFGQMPLLGIDVWEHAYYLKYQNRRADYLNAWWHVVDWSAVAQRFERARG